MQNCVYPSEAAEMLTAEWGSVLAPTGRQHARRTIREPGIGTRFYLVLVRGDLHRKGSETILLVERTRQGSVRAYEYDRTRAAIRPTDARDGESIGVAVVSVSALWEHIDDQVRLLLAKALDADWASSSQDTAPSV